MKNLTEEQVRDILAKRVKSTSQAQTARELGISGPFLHDVIHGNRSVSESMAAKLGFERIILYKRAS